MNQPWYTYVPSLEPLSHLPSHLIPPGCHRAQSLSSLHHMANSYWLSILHMALQVSMLLSQCVPHFPSPTVSTSLFTNSAPPLLPCKQVYKYHPSRFHRYVLVYGICFSLSNVTRTIGSRFIYLIITDSNVFLFSAEQSIGSQESDKTQ